MAARDDKSKMAKAALQKLQAMSKAAGAASSADTGGSRHQASAALKQLFRLKGEEVGEMDGKLGELLDRILKHQGSAPAPKATAERPVPLGESPEELAAKMGPEPSVPKKPEMPRRRLVMLEEGGMSASIRVKVRDARKALQTKDERVTELTRELKLCRKEVWDLQCEANAADLRVARILQQHADKLPEKYRLEFDELKQKEEQLADQLSAARAEAQRWASVAKRQDAMLQQEREEQRGSDAKSILMKHPAGEVFWTPGPESDSEDDEAIMKRIRGRGEDVTLGSSDEDYNRPATRAELAKAKARFEAESRMDDSDSPSDDSEDAVVRPVRAAQGGVASAPAVEVKSEPTTLQHPPAPKAVPPLPALSTLPASRVYDDQEEVYSEDSISEDIAMSARSM